MSKIAWIGMGRMGTPMVGHLVKAGHEVTVYDIVLSKCEEMDGVKIANSPAEAANGAEFVFTMVNDAHALGNCMLDNNGVVEGLTGGEIVIDMSTVSIEISEECDKAITAKGATFLCAPVAGSVVIAEAAQLTIMCSGPKDSFDKATEIFSVLSKKQYYMGEKYGSRAMKLALNMLLATQTQILAESLAFCEKAGVNPDVALDVITDSTAYSKFYSYKIPGVRDRSFKVSFPVWMMAKDLRLALGCIDQLRMAAPVTTLVKQMLDSLDAQGYGEKDQTYLVCQMEKMAGLNPEEMK